MNPHLFYFLIYEMLTALIISPTMLILAIYCHWKIPGFWKLMAWLQLWPLWVVCIPFFKSDSDIPL
jgi:hypothetical protein